MVYHHVPSQNYCPLYKLGQYTNTISTHPHIPVGLLVESHINNMLNFTATQKPEMNHEKYPVFPSHENGFPRGYNHLQSIFIHFSSTRLYNLQYFSIFWVPQPNCGWVSRISFEKWRLRIFVYLFWAPGRPFSGEEKGGNPQLLWSLVAILGITEIGNPFFKMYPLVMADIAMENDP